MKLVAIAVMCSLGLATAAHHAHADPAPGHGQLKQALLERFHRNHDGKLDAEERHRAARALRRIASRLEAKDRHDGHPRGAGAAPAQGAAPSDR